MGIAGNYGLALFLGIENKVMVDRPGQEVQKYPVKCHGIGAWPTALPDHDK